MYLLEELWKGHITPNERAVREGSPYQRISQESCQCISFLQKELSDEERQVLDRFCQNEVQLSEIAEQDSFIRGVRIGARFILDVIGTYNSQLSQMWETIGAG